MKPFRAYKWNAAKRRSNLMKHGLDFPEAYLVIESRYCLNLLGERSGEQRVCSFAYVFDYRAVLVVVHAERGDSTVVISFRRASKDEREFYYEWLATSFEGPSGSYGGH
jgi:uncharacterized DUF497 family protein